MVRGFFFALRANGEKNERSKCRLSLPKWLNFSAQQGTYLKRVAHEIRVLHGVWALLFVKMTGNCAKKIHCACLRLKTGAKSNYFKNE